MYEQWVCELLDLSRSFLLLLKIWFIFLVHFKSTWLAINVLLFIVGVIRPLMPSEKLESIKCLRVSLQYSIFQETSCRHLSAFSRLCINEQMSECKNMFSFALTRQVDLNVTSEFSPMSLSQNMLHSSSRQCVAC